MLVAGEAGNSQEMWPILRSPPFDIIQRHKATIGCLLIGNLSPSLPACQSEFAENPVRIV